ncbi:hypothetical protein, partial [Bifidobacterium pullorum]|uniref:hypothetical protein n=1 Tax=Bifidobacterium pullorum TaxID=78448 RepID=UPI001957CE66
MSASIAGTGHGNEIFDKGSAGQMESRVGGRDTPGLTFFAVYLPSHGWFRWFCWWFLGVCDTPVVGLFFKG